MHDMTQRERDALDDHITGHGGEDSVPDDLSSPDVSDEMIYAVLGDLDDQATSFVDSLDPLNTAAFWATLASRFRDRAQQAVEELRS